MRNVQEYCFCWCRIIGAAVLFAGGVGVLRADPQQSPTSPIQSSTLQNDAQRVQRYYDQQQPTNQTTPVDPLKQPEPPAANAHSPKLADGAHVMLKSVVFSHSALLPSSELDDAVKPFLGRDVGSAELVDLLGRVNALYAARKITTARATFANQAVTDGVVHIELVEGRLGKMSIQGMHHTHDSFVRRRVDIKAGDVVDSDTLRDDLVYLNRTTDLQVKALLQPGAERGQTDILLDVAEPDRHSLDFFVDNNGVESTGRLREGVDGHMYGLLGIDDRLDANIAHSSGANDGAVSYSIPLTPDNGRLEASYSHSQINVLNGAFRNLDITGRSTVTSLGYTQPVLATLDWLISGIGQYSIGDSTTDITGQHIADTRTRQITLGASVQHQVDGRSWSVTQLVTRLHSDEPLRGRSNFLVAPGSAYFVQRFGQSAWALRADAGWQLSSGKNIPSANLFQIGGLGSVRGYDRGIISGPRGYYVDLELHRAFGEHLDVFGFVDHGTIYSFYPTNESITGAGPGVLYHFRSWLTLSADVAKSLQTVVPNQSSIRFDARLAVHWQ
jgi:hemolysin activation/secretion protein